MAAAKHGDTVKVHYKGTLEDGSVFDSSDGREPLEFCIGAGQIIPGFEQGVIGMNPGDSKSITLGAENAYGPHRDDLALVVEKEKLPEDLNPEVGQQFQIRQEDDKTFVVTVTGIAEDSVTLDANHPLAGKQLTFDVDLVEIAAAE